jgi:hypothetical protein
MEPIDAQPWIQFLQVGGVATVCLFAIGIALWRGLKWFAGRLDAWIAPLVSEHLGLVRELREAVHELRASLAEVKADLKDLNRPIT